MVHFVNGMCLFFYFVSGIFLYVSLNNNSWSSILLKKFQTNVVPYFLWCLIPMMLKGRLGLAYTIDEIFAFSKPAPCGNPHLWYLHCLIVFIGVTMLIWKILAFLPQFTRRILFGVIFIIFFLFVEFLGIKTLYGTPTSPFYFLSGFVFAPSFLASKIKKSAWCVLIIIAITSKIIRLVLAPRGFFEIIMRVLCVYSGIFSVYGALFELTKRKWLPKFSSLLQPVFFVYCSHGLLLPVCRYVCADVFEIPTTWIGMIVLSILVLLLSFGIANIVKKMNASVYEFLSGGR